MAKDDFIDLLDFSAEENQNAEDAEGTLSTIIKEKELAVDDNTMLVSEQKIIEGEAFILRMYKKDDVIDSIEIECRCGRTAKIQLEYGQSPEDTLPESGVSDQPVEKSPHTQSEGELTGFYDDSGDEDEEFQNGIAAEIISSDSDSKIIDLAVEDSADEENEDADK